MKYVLGIETTCDETAAAVVAEGKEILSNVVASQSKIHARFGGVFPELAAREHSDLLLPTIQEALKEAGLSHEAIDLIAVAQGPGLIGSLLIGITGAKALSLAWGKPYVGVNHVEAHLYAAMMSHGAFIFPSLGVVVSGGHTFIVHLKAVGKYELLGKTVDDALGEAFDKVAFLLGLPYPGGPHVEELAKKGNCHRYPFKAGKMKESRLDFSFSGLKTNVLYAVKGQNGNKKSQTLLSEKEKADVAASFQYVALSDIVSKTLHSLLLRPCHAIYFGGGVSSNQRLRTLFAEKNLPIPIYWPSKQLSLDNAAMIAGLGFHVFQGQSAPFSMEALPRIPL